MDPRSKADLIAFLMSSYWRSESEVATNKYELARADINTLSERTRFVINRNAFLENQNNSLLEYVNALENTLNAMIETFPRIEDYFEDQLAGLRVMSEDLMAAAPDDSETEEEEMIDRPPVQRRLDFNDPRFE